MHDHYKTYIWHCFWHFERAKKPLAWKRYIDDIFAIWDIEKTKSRNLLNMQIATIQLSNLGLKFPIRKLRSSTQVYKGKRFAKESRLHIKTHFKATETFQHMHFSSCHHPPGVKKGFIKGEALWLLRTNSSKSAFDTAVKQFKTNFIARVTLKLSF